MFARGVIASKLPSTRVLARELNLAGLTISTCISANLFPLFLLLEIFLTTLHLLYHPHHTPQFIQCA